MTIQFWQYILLATHKKKRTAHGFTLIELLISIVISSIVTIGLLFVVNELIQLDRREARLETVQRDMQRAMDYISDELKESVYVYPDPTFITDQLSPTDFPAGAVPVLAFWKPEPLSTGDYGRLPIDCLTLPAPPARRDRANCSSLKLRQSYYSLVVYFALDNTANSPNWEGQTRIIRYALPQYVQSNLTTTAVIETPGFATPNNDFANWTPAQAVDAAGNPRTNGAGDPILVPTAGNWSVLVDYVDARNSVYGPLVDVNGPEGCQQFETRPGVTTEYTRSPINDAAANASASFLACIRTPGNGVGTNQDVVVMLRGNTKTMQQEIANPTPAVASGSLIPSQSALPTLKSQILVRGAANKAP